MRSKSQRVLRSERRLRRMQHSVESLDGDLRRKAKELAAREDEIDVKRAEIDRLRRRLEGLL